MNGNKVIIGMSGGVDSSVAALLLKEQGYEVVGVTMQIWQDEEQSLTEESGCCSLTAVEDARRVAQILSIPYYVMNFKDVFKSRVMDYFVEEYLAGRTPNPCIACNRHVKWEAMLRRSMEIGADFIATGHYARVALLANGRYAIRSSVTADKDQTYALYNLTQFQLEHTLMPVGEYRKEEIRAIAVKNNLPIAHKPDSQDICFVPDGDHGGFLQRYGGAELVPGDFVDEDGRVLGRHRGLPRYTTGQRRGLGVSADRPLYVLRKDIALQPGDPGGRVSALQPVRLGGWISIGSPCRPAVRWRSPPRPATARPRLQGRCTWSRTAACGWSSTSPSGR